MKCGRVVWSMLSPHMLWGRILSRERLSRMRAYKSMQFTKGEKPIFDFINALAAQTFLYDPQFFRGFAPARYEAQAVLAFRQKLLRTTLDNDLAAGTMIMLAGTHAAPFAARLPGPWRRALLAGGLSIHWVSPVLWLFVVARKFKEAVSFYRHGLRSGGAGVPESSYALLLGLPPRAYTGSLLSDQRSYINFVSWFRHKYASLHLRIVAATVPEGQVKPQVTFHRDTWPPLPDLHARARFKKCAWHIMWHSLCAFMRGRWEYAFMARDVMELEYVRLLDKNMLPERVAVTNSHYVNRPLWSYYLEDCGIETGLYFYSTNTFNMDLREGEYGQVYGYNLMSWSHYYTATPEHAAFLDAVTSYPKIVEVVGTIPLEDNGMPLSEKKKPVVAYFDVQPFRDAFMACIGRPTPLYFYEASRQNLEDLILSCKKYGFDLVLKPKRDVGSRLCPRYKRLIDDLAARGEIQVVDSYIAADRVVAWADVVISQPFTSVALVGVEAGKPSVYYDALGLYKKEQPAAQGIAVLQDKNSLSDWLQTVLDTQKFVA